MQKSSFLWVAHIRKLYYEKIDSENPDKMCLSLWLLVLMYTVITVNSSAKKHVCFLLVFIFCNNVEVICILFSWIELQDDSIIQLRFDPVLGYAANHSTWMRLLHCGNLRLDRCFSWWSLQNEQSVVEPQILLWLGHKSNLISFQLFFFLPQMNQQDRGRFKGRRRKQNKPNKNLFLWMSEMLFKNMQNNLGPWLFWSGIKQ